MGIVSWSSVSGVSGVGVSVSAGVSGLSSSINITPSSGVQLIRKRLRSGMISSAFIGWVLSVF